ncbi:hypothetical protein HN371_26305 [Candidatus Poribacteria bacterium]|jgi:hypothetical protein|nr:hypothetical protein [Candidatus Poribacteria bacterium]MBT5532758.1 hypothetical protein [Candidatus Poribacteria bacterium]MBT5711248.1 hypothetical protein [Candidatus Poribacteria bacterium]MBT7101483.1 hypothetical protein [Candidatus Poribacteria bacterium]MBT7804611.1 hypothetical protein [Candidatus Poribacteria bacterium]
MTRLPELTWRPRAASLVGCLEGIAGYLGVGASPAWIAAAVGQAFLLIVDDTLCPSGPSEWDYLRTLKQTGPNVGLDIAYEGAFPHADDFGAKQAAIRRSTQRHLDNGVPCFGWHFEFIVINGYDDSTYHLSGPLDGSRAAGAGGPMLWREFGAGAVGFVEMLSARKTEPATGARVVRDALRLAVDIAHEREGHPEWGCLAAYDNWVRGLEAGNDEYAGGAGYHAAIWSECRGFAVEFLKEAGECVPGVDDLLQHALAHYATVHERLADVARLFPPPWEDRAVAADEARWKAAANHVAAARDAETRGVAALETALAAM